MGVISGDFTITRGDTYRENWTIKDETATPIDLTGGKLYFTIKNAVTDADPGVLQLTSPSSGITITNAAQGQAQMVITNTQSAALSPQTYVYDIQFKDASGNITTLAKGRLTVEPDVTTSTE